MNLFLLILILNSNSAFSQCDETLVEKAIRNSGTDVLFIRDFEIKNIKKRVSFLTPVESYELRLNKGLVYRFYVENEENFEAEAIMQIYDDNMLLASTYNFETLTNEKTFDFICEESGNYELVMSFINPAEGCAAGIMSVVITDSLNFEDLIEKTELSNIIYIGVDNFLDIATNEKNAAKIDVKINKGTIEFTNELYKVNVDEEGEIIITATVRDSVGNIVETFTEQFIAKFPKLPRVKFKGNAGGLISKDEIIYGKQTLEFDNKSDFEIVEFTVSRFAYTGGIKAFNTNVLSSSQLNLIENLESGETFYISNIMIKSSAGIIYKLDNLGFIIE